MKKIVWLVVSCLMVLSLVMVSCGGEEDTNGTKPDGTTSDEPQYGGTITVREGVDPQCCDSFANKMMMGSLVLWWSHEQLLKFDWARGPAGTGEFTNLAVASPEAQMGGELVESVEKPDPETWILKIRQGVHYQDTGTEAGDLVGGREMTADDVAWVYERNVHSPDGAIQVLQPRCAAAFTIEKTGPWEITFTTPVQPITAQWWVIEGGGYGYMYPPEIVQTYGDLNDWHTAVGTGPWILEDWVPATSVTMRRNPNYWGENPVGPGKGDPLPYADGVKRLVIPDASTALASLRTGKIDFYGPTTYDQYEELRSSAPDLEYLEYLSDGFGNAHAFNLRLDDPTKPWALTENGKKVRQALMLAIDYDTIVRDYFSGKAEKDTVLVNRNFTGAGYKPLSQMSASIQELYSYNPEKAKQLLIDAGYPDGFKTDVLVPSAPTDMADQASIIKNMWAEIGVELNIVPIEGTMLTPMVTRSFDWDDIFYGTFAGGTVGSFGFSLYTYFGYYRGDNRPQFASRTDPDGTPDPVIEAAFKTTQENIYVNWPAAYKAVEEIRPYLIENAFKIPFPQPYSYNFWWPWMKNTYGQGQVAYFLKYYWVDQALKTEMGY
ncbi:MAG: ABC transporter substrate-binding protein [Dehalococcoidales bacterium]|nr:MAG: ABC transporter substrate-binding protein [Dehalococcoidales bacterium]